MRRRFGIAFCLALLLGSVAGAVGVDSDTLKDPVLEARARAIMGTLRCLVCQNQSIEESNADLARDLRRIVRQRVAAGDSDDATRAYIVARYGDWVLLRPPFKTGTLLLWLGPLMVLLLGGLALRTYFRHQGETPSDSEAPLSAAEKKKLKALLGDGGEG